MKTWCRCYGVPSNFISLVHVLYIFTARFLAFIVFANPQVFFATVKHRRFLSSIKLRRLVTGYIRMNNLPNVIT